MDVVRSSRLAGKRGKSIHQPVYILSGPLFGKSHKEAVTQVLMHPAEGHSSYDPVFGKSPRIVRCRSRNIHCEFPEEGSVEPKIEPRCRQRIPRIHSLGKTEPGQFLYAGFAQPGEVNRRPQGDERLVGANVGCGFLPSYVLLSGLERKTETGASVRIYGATDYPAGELTDEFLPRRHETQVRPAEIQAVTQTLAFPNHKIGNPPGDASRVMWPAFAKAAGIAPDSVNFVNVGPTAKIAALKAHTVDIISDFYNEHDLKVIEFGADLGYVNWKDIGLNPYGNSLIVNGAFLEKNPKLVEEFVRISQKAYAACVADVAPCLKALLDQVSGLDKENQERQWERIKFLMTDEFTTTKGLGWIDGARMKKDYELVHTYLGMEKPFDVSTAFSTKMLDPAVKMDASKVKK